MLYSQKKGQIRHCFYSFFLIFFRAGLLLCTFLRQEGRKVPFLSLFSKSVNLLKLKLFRGNRGMLPLYYSPIQERTALFRIVRRLFILRLICWGGLRFRCSLVRIARVSLRFRAPTLHVVRYLREFPSSLMTLYVLNRSLVRPNSSSKYFLMSAAVRLVVMCANFPCWHHISLRA